MAVALPFLKYISAAASVASGIAGIQSANYQAAVAENNAALLAQQAEREAFAANQDIADRSANSRAEIAAMMAQMEASGINSTSGSMLLRRQGFENLATRDIERLSQKRDINLENTKRQSSQSRSEASAYRSSAALGIPSLFLNAGNSFLSTATMVNEYNKGRLALRRPSYSGV